MGKKKPPKKPSPKKSPPKKSPPKKPFSDSKSVPQISNSNSPASNVDASLAAAVVPGSPTIEIPLKVSFLSQEVTVTPAMENPETALKKSVPVTVAKPTIPEQTQHSAPATESPGKKADSNLPQTNPGSNSATDTWRDVAKGSRLLLKKGTSFTLPSGEACVKIPNSVIEKNQKAWECFVLGQFYHDPPSQGTVHKIVNGIWSRYYNDISVSKMEGNSFLFRIPNHATRNRVLTQRLWQIEGQTMFVGKWQPGVVPTKPELTSAPIWLELRNVPLQFFNEDALERIAGMVGQPKLLHPSTANKTNLEVAKVLTLIDPRSPLPEAVNAQFDSGDVVRIGVSSPWMPPVCGHCKEIGHNIKKCKLAPILCPDCKSSSHSSETCPKRAQNTQKKEGSRRLKAKEKLENMIPIKQQKVMAYVEVIKPKANPPEQDANSYHEGLLRGESSGEPPSNVSEQREISETGHELAEIEREPSEAERDSSDISSKTSESDVEAENITSDDEFTKVLSKRQRKLLRGSGPKKS